MSPGPTEPEMPTAAPAVPATPADRAGGAPAGAPAPPAPEADLAPAPRADLPTAPRADLRFALSRPWRLVALGFGSGLSPVAPGTAGSLFGWASYVLLAGVLPDAAWPPLLLVAFVAGVPVCAEAARALRTDDPSPVVWDEIAAIWLVLWALQPAPGQAASWWVQLAGFAAFRLFDAVKRGPVGWVDRRVKGGTGIMLDDLVAAGLTLALVEAALWAWGRLHGA